MYCSFTDPLWLVLFNIRSSFQSDLSQEVLKLGLLFGAEDTLEGEEKQDVLSFGHKSLQEYAGGHYVAPLSKVLEITQFTQRHIKPTSGDYNF